MKCPACGQLGASPNVAAAQPSTAMVGTAPHEGVGQRDVALAAAPITEQSAEDEPLYIPSFLRKWPDAPPPGEPRRYRDTGDRRRMEQTPRGDYVKWHDYEALRTRLAGEWEKMSMELESCLEPGISEEVRMARFRSLFDSVR